MYSDAIFINTELKDVSKEQKVIFEPFIGVGPRRFFDFFSINLGSGRNLKRKGADGKAYVWEGEGRRNKNRRYANFRFSEAPYNYIEKEVNIIKIMMDKDEEEKHGEKGSNGKKRTEK